jgi:ATP-dependent DNA helicase PIF1
MMSKKLFTILDKIGRLTRKRDDLPFGGIQVIFSGDFYQLPPVGDSDDKDTSAFCFESETWNNTFGPECIVQLKTIFRQTDKEYSDILNQIRIGKLKKSSYDKLMTRVIPSSESSLVKSGIKPTIMLPKRRDVDLINSTEMAKLDLSGNQKEEFTMSVVQDSSSSSSSSSYSNKAFYQKAKKYPGAELVEYVSEQTKEFEIKFLKENVMVGEKIMLTIGTQVMCVANIDMD